MKIARFAIFLTGLICLAAGGVIGVSSLQNQQEESILKTNESLKAQGRAYVDYWFSVIESSRVAATRIDALAGSSSSSDLAISYPAYISAKGSVKISQGILTEVDTLSNETDLLLRDRILRALRAQILFGDLLVSKVAVGTYELNEEGGKEGIFVATFASKTQTKAEEKINFVLVDPAIAFVGLSKINSTSETLFIFNKEGKVIADSSGAYRGTNLKGIASLRESIENLFLGAQTGLVSRYQALDGTQKQIAFIRTGAFPFAIGVERKIAPPVLSKAWLSEQVQSGATRKSLGFSIVMMGIVLALMSAMSIWLSKEMKKQESKKHEPMELKPWSERPWSMKPPLPQLLRQPSAENKIALSSIERASIERASMDQALIQATQIFSEKRENIQQEQVRANESANQLNQQLNHQMNILVARDYEREFSDRAPEDVEKHLVEISAELTESPVLFFQYQRKTQNLALASVAGAVKIPSFSPLQVFVRKDIEQQVEKISQEGRVASVSNYAPIAKLMMDQLSVAHFEAWAVTSDAEVSQNSKMVGVLVVLQASFRSAETRPVLAKILREAGNLLFARQNRIQISDPNRIPIHSYDGSQIATSPEIFA